MNFGMLREFSKSHLEVPSFCHPGASRNKSGINFSAIGSILLVITLCLVACGDDSGTSANNDISSSSVTLSGTSVTSNGSKASSSSKKVSSSSRVNSVGSSSVGKSSSSSSAKKASSSSSKVFTCSVEGELVERKNKVTREYEWYICKDGISVLYYFSSSSQKVLTFKENFKKDSVFNDQIEYGTFKDPRDDQEYKTVVIKSKYEEFEVFAQNLNYGTQIKLGTTEFDDKKVEKYCYDDDPWYCENYFGGMYSWSEAMGLPKACDSVWTGTTPECPDSVVVGAESEYDWNGAMVQGICPEGWHVMNKTEWQAMIGGRENGSYNVLSQAYRGDNSNGFSALLAGGLLMGGEFRSERYAYISKDGDLDAVGFYWFPSEVSALNGGVMLLMKREYKFSNSSSKKNGYSIRCVKDYKTTD